MSCFKPVWDIAFISKHNIDGWRIEGTIPFTKHQLYMDIARCASARWFEYIELHMGLQWGLESNRCCRASIYSIVNVDASPVGMDIPLDQLSSISRQQVLHTDPKCMATLRRPFTIQLSHILCMSRCPRYARNILSSLQDGRGSYNNYCMEKGTRCRDSISCILRELTYYK